MAKEKTSYSISTEAKQLLSLLADKHTIKLGVRVYPSDMLDIVIKEAAKREKIKS